MAKKKEIKPVKKSESTENIEDSASSFIEVTDEDLQIQSEIYADTDNSDIIVDSENDGGENEEYSEEQIDELNWDLHLEKSKTNKIFNNSYNTDDNLKEPWEYEYGKSITVEKSYEGRFDENYNPDGHLLNIMTKSQVEVVINKHEHLKQIFYSSTDKKKYSKKEINDIFKIIFTEIKQNNTEYSFIYIFDFISKYIDLNYKKMFDMLDYQYKEVLILELNEQYNLLDNYKNLGNFF